MALLNAALAIMVIVCREHRWAWYVCILMAVDYALRVILGSRASVLGAMSEWVTHRWTPIWGQSSGQHTEEMPCLHRLPLTAYSPPLFPSVLCVCAVPGAAKQFAGCCGAMFCAGAALAFFEEGDSTHAGGAVIMGILLGCALMEGALNVCVACVMYKMGLGVLDLSWLNDSTSDATRVEYEKTWAEEETPLHEVVPDVEVKLSNTSLTKDGGMATNGGRELVYRYRGSTDAMKRESFKPIKQIRLHYFNISLGLTGIALMFYYTSQPNAFNHPDYIWKTLAIASGVVSSFIFVLYLLRVILYPRKVVREWANPITRNHFCAVPLSILLFVPFAAEYAGGGLGIDGVGGDLVFARVLFWIAAPALLLLTVVQVSMWITRPFDQDLLTPSVFFPVLANVVASLMLPIVRPDFVEGAWLFFSFSLFMWVVVTALFLTKAIHRSPLDDRMRPAITFLFANPLMLFIAYTTIQSVTASQQAVAVPYQLDAPAFVLYYTGLIFFLVNVALVLQAYFGRTRFDVTYWGFSFPLCVAAIAAVQYLQLRNTPLTQGIATTAVVIAAYVLAILAANTVTAILNRKMFTAWSEQQNSPNFLRLQHYALEECTASLAQKLHKGVFSAYQVQQVQDHWTDFLALFEQHSSMEDVEFFPVVERLFPGCTDVVQQQHHQLHESLDAVTAAVSGLSSPQFAAGSEDEKRQRCQSVAAEAERFLAVMTPHLEEEIAHVTPVMRKHISNEQGKMMVRNAWHRLDIALWRRAIPCTLRFQYNHTRRLRFLAAFRTSIPEQMTTIAKIVFEGCDRLLYERLCVDFPELRVRETKEGLMNKVW